MLSTQIKQRHAELKRYKKQHKKEIEDLSQEIEKREKSQFEYFQALPIGSVNISDINYERMHDLLKNDYENPNVLTAVSSLMRSVIYTSGDQTAHIERIRHWIRKMTLLSSGAYGQTLVASLDGGEQDFIVKVPGSREDSPGLFHEMMVGILCANELRKGNSEYPPVPNFSYIYGGFKCSHPILGINDKPVTFCNVEDNIQYVLYENVSPAANAGDYFDKGPKEDFLNSLLQLCFALKIGLERFDFSHGDLHPQNVRLRRFPEMMSIPYYINGNTVYINTHFVAVIIDYGMSHFRLDGENYGYSDAYTQDNFPDLSFPLHDIFQYITWAAKWSGKRNPELFSFLERLFVFFDRENLRSFIEKTKQFGPFLPRPQFGDRKLDEFLDFLTMNFGVEIDRFISDQPKYEIFGCEMCDSENLLMSEISGTGLPEDPFEFYDQMRSMGESTDRILSKYDYRQGFFILWQRINDIYKSLTLLLRNTPFVRIQDVNFADLDEINAYLVRTDNVGRIVDLIQSFLTIEKVYDFLEQAVFSLYNIKINRIDHNWLENTIRKINYYLKQITRDIKYLERKKGINRYAEKVYEQIKWYSDLQI